MEAIFKTTFNNTVYSDRKNKYCTLMSQARLPLFGGKSFWHSMPNATLARAPDRRRSLVWRKTERRDKLRNTNKFVVEQWFYLSSIPQSQISGWRASSPRNTEA